MSKKWKMKTELEESVKTEATPDQCQVCRIRFFGSTLARESHIKLYPSHFIVGAQVVVGEEKDQRSVSLKPKLSKAQTNKTKPTGSDKT